MRAWVTRLASSSAVKTVLTASAASIRHSRRIVFESPLHRDQQRLGGQAEAEHRRAEPQHRPLRAGQGQVLRHHLADHRVQEDHHAQGQHERHRMHGRLRQPERVRTGASSRCASAGSAIAPRPSEQIVMPSCAPAIISGISFIARSATRARRLVAASGSTTVRREAIRANSLPTKNALPSSSRTAISELSHRSGLRRRHHADLLDPAPLHLDHGELPAVLLARVSPATGMWPSRASRKPASVSYGPSGSRKPVSSASSSSRSTPSTSQVRAPPGR